jgi:hypothetical protein
MQLCMGYSVETLEMFIGEQHHPVASLRVYGHDLLSGGSTISMLDMPKPKKN